MGKYVTNEEILLRLRNKVKVTENPDDPGEQNKMSLAFLNRLVLEAESQVEMDLSPRYAAPFTGRAGETFAKLPETTKNYIKTLCEAQGVIKILETDFGRGTVTDSSKYTERLDKRYNDMVDKHLKLREKSFNLWKYPPFPNLALATFNTADTGFVGIAFSDSQFDRGDFPSKQINSPGENLFNGFIDE